MEMMARGTHIAGQVGDAAKSERKSSKIRWL